MTRRQAESSQGFSIIAIFIALVVLAALGFGGWYVWHENKGSGSAKTNTTSQTTKTVTPADPSEGGKYLVIKEWSVRVAVPQSLMGKVTYTIETATDPDTNLPLVAAKILVVGSSLDENACATSATSLGSAVFTGAQYIRSDNTKPFNAARYKQTFKENVLADNSYSYHLNYLTPDCIGGGTNATKIEELQASLSQLVKIN